MTSNGNFSEEDKLKSLLWCDRHCCLCGKQCGTNIEVHHIIPKKEGKNGIDVSNIDNAIPLCFECHANIGNYNRDHPKGEKYKPNELKIRRDQIYEKYTQSLVPPINYQITQIIDPSSNRTRVLPDVGFILTHLGTINPIRVYFALDLFYGKQRLGLIETTNRIYCGENPIYLHPMTSFHGHFPIKPECLEFKETIEIRVNIKILDIYDRPHFLYPVGFVYMSETNNWFFEPSTSLHVDNNEYSLEGWGTPGPF